MLQDPILLHDWHPVASLAQLEQSPILSVRLLGEDLVVWRCGDQLLAWQDLCLHRGARLSLGWVRDERLVCPYHGWEYSADGQCVHIPAHPTQAPPAKARVKTYHAQVRYGLVWVALGEPHHPIPPFPEWEDAAFRKILCGPYRVKASGPRIVENFLDVAHFPFVHEGILGDPAHPEISDYQAEITHEGVVARGVRVYQPNGYGDGRGAEVEYTYKALRPLTAYLLKESDGPRFSILLAITPHDAVDSSAWMWMAMNYGHDIPEATLVAWQDRIFMQDRPIVESQRPELLPLDLQAELHLRSDRTAIAYRRWLKQLGVTVGVA
ncbi:MAG: aromatic ring-hydroxylating dioxygenase subunit alpha [Thermoflexales bacterium]|nr:aromatic ring-hydroxylating dioxygenase subunit alpha [Thermoflexales bacterium]MCS7323750.1 aromatic ring-hydroxylating dioxygenase subunit alpha [Thermoflexales bacterium]MDW8053856.1 aromatic ring-hydroxylating dioxygenase subunit alpha [Anaerolineae bacterium]MDW8292387.1 aromatic ring-hydroxylating dioxygenase subunit alpha [Anaerolineae bacterium]